jgi:hypothetical protein
MIPQHRPLESVPTAAAGTEYLQPLSFRDVLQRRQAAGGRRPRSQGLKELLKLGTRVGQCAEFAPERRIGEQQCVARRVEHRAGRREAVANCPQSLLESVHTRFVFCVTNSAILLYVASE